MNYINQNIELNIIACKFTAQQLKEICCDMLHIPYHEASARDVVNSMELMFRLASVDKQIWVFKKQGYVENQFPLSQFYFYGTFQEVKDYLMNHYIRFTEPSSEELVMKQIEEEIQHRRNLSIKVINEPKLLK